MDILKGPIDTRLLELELTNAIQAEQLRNLQNSAKIRAVEQRVPTYEDFRQIVNAAHLKPFKPKTSMRKENGNDRFTEELSNFVSNTNLKDPRMIKFLK